MAIFQASDVIEMALEIEKSGEAFYRAVATKAQSPQVQALFEELADMEVDHFETFKQLSKTQWSGLELPEEQWDQYLTYLQATVQSAFFEGQDKALALADQVNDEKQALRMAMGFEKETLLFFHDLRDMVTEGNKEVVKQIIDEEKSHLRLLADMLQSV